MKKKTKKKETYQLLMYCEGCSPKIKRFKTLKEAGVFVEKFQAQYPDHMALYSDNWIDYMVTDISGEVHFFTDGLEVE